MSVYALSDLHGMYELWEKIKKFLQPEDTLYFLGDAADRGPDGYKIMKELLADDRVIYLKGNHEDFFVKGINEYLIYGDMNYDLWTFDNGGWDTFLEAIEDTPTILQSVHNRIFKLPFFSIYQNENNQLIYLSHAGYYVEELFEATEKDLLWNRTHFRSPWPNKEEYKHAFLVHGHTPTPFLKQELVSIANFYDKEPNFVNNDGAIFYCDGHKIDIDCGAFATSATVLLDLDTFETFSFKASDMTEEQAKLLY